MERLTIVGLIMLAALITMLFIPSIEVHKKIYYDDSRYEYGRATYWMYKDGWDNGYLYGMKYDGDLYFVYLGKYEKFVDAPEYLGGGPTSHYFSDSVIYIGDDRGRIYYADPENGKIIWTMDLRTLHIYFNATNSTTSFYHYHILYGNRSGYFYLLFNGTIYHLYRDVKILDKYHYSFRGYPVEAYPWKGGLIIKFMESGWEAPWGTPAPSARKCSVYYVKNGSVIWKLTFLSEMSKWQPNPPDVQIFEDYVYYFKGSTISVYRNGKKKTSIHTNGEVVGLQRMKDKFYVTTYLGNKNLLSVYDKNFLLIKQIELFDMKSIGVEEYDISNQKVEIYRNKTGYTVFLYTYFGYENHPKSYIPMRIIYLDKNLNVTWSDSFKIGEVTNAYPLPEKNKFMVVEEMGDLYFVKVKNLVDVNFFAWMNIKIPIFVFLLIVPGYFYVISKEIEIKRRNPPYNL